MARGKANSDPAHYGGGGLATAGLILGVLGLILGLGVWIFEIAMGGLGVIMNAAGR